MSAYQHFLNFFSMYNKERLDGLGWEYFTAMTNEELARAFDHLLAMVEKGGSQETVNGLFTADAERAVQPVLRLLEAGRLNDEAEMAAAFHLWQMQYSDRLPEICMKYMNSLNRDLRQKAVYYMPSIKLTDALKRNLHNLVLHEDDRLTRIRAVEKLFECYGVDKATVGKDAYLKMYRALHGEDAHAKQAVFRQLDDMYR